MFCRMDLSLTKAIAMQCNTIRTMATGKMTTVALMASRGPQLTNILVGRFSLQQPEVLQEHGLNWKIQCRMDLNTASSLSQDWWHTLAQCRQRRIGFELSQDLHQCRSPSQALWQLANVSSTSIPPTSIALPVSESVSMMHSL